MPTRKPSTSVFLKAVRKRSILRTLEKTSVESLPSTIMLSIRSMNSGYSMKRRRNTMSTAIVLTMIGSEKNFCRSSLALCEPAINPPFKKLRKVGGFTQRKRSYTLNAINCSLPMKSACVYSLYLNILKIILRYRVKIIQ